MTLSIRRFQPNDSSGIERLNDRLRARRVLLPVYSEGPQDKTESGEFPIRERLFVAAEDDEIRGAAWLREHAFWAGDREVTAGWLKYPVAESLVDPRYNGVPAALVLKLLKEQPNLFALGLGGHESPLARLLAAMGWIGSTVPFLYRVVRPARVLRELPYARRSRVRRMIMDILAKSGLGFIGFKALAGIKSIFSPSEPHEYRGEIVDTFGEWADALWVEQRNRYSIISDRSARMLNCLYPATFEGLTRIRVTRAGVDVGWVCLLRRNMRQGAGDEHFGNLALGLIADCLSAPEDARGVLQVGIKSLLDADVDLIFSNQSHPEWVTALKSLQFLEGPSNFAFYRSPKTASWLSTDDHGRRAFLNRGDCDGPRWV